MAAGAAAVAAAIAYGAGSTCPLEDFHPPIHIHWPFYIYCIGYPSAIFSNREAEIRS